MELAVTRLGLGWLRQLHGRAEADSQVVLHALRQLSSEHHGQAHMVLSSGSCLGTSRRIGVARSGALWQDAGQGFTRGQAHPKYELFLLRVGWRELLILCPELGEASLLLHT